MGIEKIKEKFNEDVEENPKKKTKKSKAKKADIPKYDESLYDTDEYNNNPSKKFKRSAAKFFDTTIDRLGDIANLLNGRKIDGFIVNELVGRLGFFNLKRMNRQKLADLKNHRDGSQSASILSVDMATEKLKTIIHDKNPQKAYTDYIEGYTKTVNKEISDEASEGA
jgi:hypothetical protein|tara:strand:- start:229 stop:729 length:501 start_codon:yes stop_codon:yes gene_type:complete